MAENSKAFRDAKRDAVYNVDLGTSAGADPSAPDYRHPAYNDTVERIEFVRDCAGGTETMREGRITYLPKMAREEEDDYERRRKAAVAFNATARTVSGLAGMVFRKDIQIKGPDAVLEDMKDVDLMGSDLDMFGRALLEGSVGDGHQWLVVDSPPADPNRTKADEIVQGIRPYWVRVDPVDAINWQYEMRNGRPELSLFVYREVRSVPDGTYGSTAEVCYRVLRPGSFEVWKERKTKAGTEFVLIEEGVRGVEPVTVVYVPALNKVPEESRPPVLDIAYNQVAHFQRWSLYNSALDYAVPMPWVTGIKAKDVEFGPNRLLALPSTEATIGYLEMTGSALDSNRQQLEDLKQQMAQLGLSMLAKESRAAETAAAKEIDKSESDSALAVMARQLQGSLNQALRFHSMYRSTEPATCAVNMDFTSQRLDAQTISTLSSMVALDQMSLDTMWSVLIAGEILPDSFDPEVEQSQLGGMPPE